MKKNKLFILGLVTVFVALVSLTLVSSTWAKYTTTASGYDQARVAYWGFNHEGKIAIENLFGKTYNAVVSDDDVIAPGTEGSATFSFTYKGNTSKGLNAPEVAYTFVVDTTGSYCDDAIKNNPNIKWALDGTWYNSWADLIAAIEALDGNKEGNRYAENSMPEEFEEGKTHTIQWKWLYDATIDGADDNDSNDTEMGNAADLADVKIVITITAIQQDN